jgi:hypothetical protein
VPLERILDALLFLDDMPGRESLTLLTSFEEKLIAPRSKVSVAMAPREQGNQVTNVYTSWKTNDLKEQDRNRGADGVEEAERRSYRQKAEYQLNGYSKDPASSRFGQCGLERLERGTAIDSESKTQGTC